MLIRAKDTLLFIGDSITDAGRARPVGEGNGLGEGYVSLVDGLLAAHHPEASVRVINTGTSGNRIIDLEARWGADVIALSPTWLSVMIGINDVWRQFDSPHLKVQVDADLFRDTYRRLIERTLPSLEGLVLMTPYFIEPHRDDPMRRQMDEYGAIVRDLAGAFGCRFSDTQSAFDTYLAANPGQTLAGDRVHPNRKGHSIIASSFLNAVEFGWRADL